MSHTLSISKRQALALAIAQTLITGSSTAATITVTSATDDNMGCTLREALVAANADLPFGGCQAGNGADVVVFDSSILPATITLQSNPIAISSAVTLQGPGSDQLTVSGENATQLVQVTDGNAAVTQVVEISGLGVVSGQAGEFVSPGD